MPKVFLQPHLTRPQLLIVVVCRAILRSIGWSHFKTVLLSLSFLVALQVHAGEKNSCKRVFEATPQEQLADFQHRFESANRQAQEPLSSMTSAYLLKNGLETSAYEADQLAFNPRGVSPRAKAHRVPGQVETHFPYPEFLGDRLSFNNNNYRLINVGHHQQAQDWLQIQNAVQRGRDEAPTENIVVQMSPTWSYGRKVLKSWSEHVGEEVIKTYKKRKPYLSSSDLFYLEQYDKTDKQNDDYFVLLKETAKSPLEYSQKDFEENLLMSIRLARMQANDPAFPYPLVGKFSANDQLPMSHRDQFQIVRDAKNVLYGLQRNQGLKVAEISRFVRFGDVPPEVMNSFLTKLFLTAIDPKDPIDLLVISVDPVTRTLFKGRYKFEDLVTIPGKTETEYLMFLDTKSDVFRTMLEKLQGGEKLIQKEKVTQSVPKYQWSQPWGVDRVLTPKSGFSYLTQGPVQTQRARKLIEERDTHVLSQYSLLRSSKVTTNRVVEVVNHTLFYGAKDFDRLIQGLSASDKVKIFENTDLFSPEWEGTIAEILRSAVGKKTILFVGEKAPAIKAVLENQFSNQQVDAVNVRELMGLEKEYDLVVVVDSISGISKEQQFKVVKTAESRVNKDGGLSLIEPFDWEGNGFAKNINTIERLTLYAQSLVSREAPMNEFELAIALRQVYKTLWQAEQNQFRYGDISKMLDEVGIEPDTVVNSGPLLGFRVLNAVRHPNNWGP